jgi:hypothetical protein
MSERVEIKFGYWPRFWGFDASEIHVEPLSEFNEVVAMVENSKQVKDKWLYPPVQKTFAPYKIPPTHVMQIESTEDSRELGELAITLVGLLEGLRLIPEEWVHFYRAAIKTHALSELVCREIEIEKVMCILQNFWQKNQGKEIRRCFFGAIHWLLFSESYVNQFERFAAQYIVLDSCFWLHRNLNGLSGQRRHAEIPSFLAQTYGIPEPSWATMLPDNTCELSRLRNEFFHEGRYGGQPIGFALTQFNPPITLQLNAFNTRLILGILGVDCSYVKSPVDTRQMHGLGLLG